MNKRQKKIHMIPYDGIRKTQYFGAKERIHGGAPFHATWFDFLYNIDKACPNALYKSKIMNKLRKMYRRKYYFTDDQIEFIQNEIPTFRELQDSYRLKNINKMTRVKRKCLKRLKKSVYYHATKQSFEYVNEDSYISQSFEINVISDPNEYNKFDPKGGYYVDSLINETSYDLNDNNIKEENENE